MLPAEPIKKALTKQRCSPLVFLIMYAHSLHTIKKVSVLLGKPQPRNRVQQSRSRQGRSSELRKMGHQGQKGGLYMKGGL